MPQKLVLVIVDGMTPAAFERAVASGRASALAFLAEHGDYRRATSVFPSLTPVCLTSIATGAGPGVHHIPSLVWWDGFDFLAYYLSGYDFASHAAGPDGAAADEALEQADAAIRALLDAAGGPNEFLERYAVVLLSDHGQTSVRQAARLEEPFADLAGQVVVTASNCAGQVYLLPGARVDASELAQRLDGFAAVDVSLRLEGGDAIA